MDEENYVERLEKIIDKQDDLLNHLDAKFNQQQSLNDTLTKQNMMLREDIKMHKDLLRDMHKTVNQHKNVVNKLKKELEEQLKIQQDLHKDYGEVIKELTDELEAEKSNNSANAPIIENKNAENYSKPDNVELPPKDFEKDYVSEATNLFNDIKDKSVGGINEISKDSKSKPQNTPKKESPKICPSCGASVQEGYVFCESCGTKL